MDTITILLIAGIIIQELQIIWINKRIGDLEDMFVMLLDDSVKKTIHVINLDDNDEEDDQGQLLRVSL